jgi:regulator of sirC expression with transglutaminase-like and TPR domain
LAGAQVADPILLQRATPKQIAMRMLQNLHGVYLRTRDFEKAIATLDLLLLGAPGIAQWYKRRGVMALDLGRHHAARRDLQKYLELEPDAADRDAIRKQLQSIHLWLAQMS